MISSLYKITLIQIISVAENRGWSVLKKICVNATPVTPEIMAKRREIFVNLSFSVTSNRIITDVAYPINVATPAPFIPNRGIKI